ncbi:hypothetical protein [Fimbriimonas ginsengisoli]|uniref:Uncharacterized protein n=1 Tax=Fimbriimonas ginsengisoli Gsoil 348 TaxID=661478 RepID=A0A068NRP0_FIMGI|nr:hypothetical protein [Fimbriimonas ginsengisoli]AIE84284.1 hypothetical protein OP10G_0916 [Fimbriimonas ginsengisoli Gsoil 348]
MAERILCDEGVRVSVSGAGERVLVAVTGGTTVRFWTAVGDLEDALSQGTPLQLSVLGGYCKLEIRDDCIHLDFAVDGSGRKTCTFPVKDLTDALDMVRNQRPEGIEFDSLTVEEA